MNTTENTLPPTFGPQHPALPQAPWSSPRLFGPLSSLRLQPILLVVLATVACGGRGAVDDLAPADSGQPGDVPVAGGDVAVGPERTDAALPDDARVSMDAAPRASDGSFPVDAGPAPDGGWGGAYHDGGGGLNHCGNGRVDFGEYCDDGNLQDGDGCSSYCSWEPGFKCTGSPSSCEPLPSLGLLTQGWCLTHQGGPMFPGAIDSFTLTLPQVSLLHGSLVASSGDLSLTVEHIDQLSYFYSISAGDDYFSGQGAAAGEHIVSVSSWLPSGPVGTYRLEICATSLQDWTCNPQDYGANDGCDCGCGLPDPDCLGRLEVVYCDFCDRPGTCNPSGLCPGSIDPANNATCL